MMHHILMVRFNDKTKRAFFVEAPSGKEAVTKLATQLYGFGGWRTTQRVVMDRNDSRSLFRASE